MTNKVVFGILAGVWALAVAFSAGLQQLCGRYKVGSGNNVSAVLYAPRGCSTTLHPSEVFGYSGQPPPDISTLEPLEAAWHFDGLSLAILQYGTAAIVLMLATTLVLTASIVAVRYRRTHTENDVEARPSL